VSAEWLGNTRQERAAIGSSPPKTCCSTLERREHARLQRTCTGFFPHCHTFWWVQQSLALLHSTFFRRIALLQSAADPSTQARHTVNTLPLGAETCAIDCAQSKLSNELACGSNRPADKKLWASQQKVDTPPTPPTHPLAKKQPRWLQILSGILI